MHSDDGTQARTIEAIERAMAAQDIGQGEMARYLGLSPSQWSNVKSGHQVLAPWMMRRVAKRLGSSAAVVSIITAATSEAVGRDAEEVEDVRGSDAAHRLATIGHAVSSVQLVLQDALSDGRLTDEEAKDLTRRFDQLVGETTRRLAGLRVTA